MALAQTIVMILGLYFGIGLVFALAFVFVGLARVNPSAAQSSLFTRLMFLPGAVGLWPVLLVTWIRALFTSAEA